MNWCALVKPAFSGSACSAGNCIVHPLEPPVLVAASKVPHWCHAYRSNSGARLPSSWSASLKREWMYSRIGVRFILLSTFKRGSRGELVNYTRRFSGAWLRQPYIKGPHQICPSSCWVSPKPHPPARSRRAWLSSPTRLGYSSPER